MKKTITTTKAVERLWAIALENRIPGEAAHVAQDLDAKTLPSQDISHGFALRWERGWGVDATLSVRPTVANGGLALVVYVGWTSTEASPVSARAASVLHGQVVDLACWMQSEIDSLPPLKSDER